jgi:hypothetical protein
MWIINKYNMRLKEFLNMGGYHPGTTSRQWDSRGSSPSQINPRYTNAINHAADKITNMVQQASSPELKDAVIADAARHFNVSFDDLKKKLHELGIITETILDEGVHDPHIFKAIFLAGTPGHTWCG